MANEIRTLFNNIGKLKNDFKQDWKEDMKVSPLPKVDYATDTATVPTNSVAPAITGTTTAGQTLTCSNGTWTNTPTFSFQWFRSGSTTPIGTASTYLLVAADQTKTITCKVTGVNTSGRLTVVSNTTATIA